METKSPMIFQKISDIMKAVEAISKDRRNEQQNYKYRGIDDIYNELHQHFAKHGVFITSEVLESKRDEKTTKSGGFLMYTILDVKFTFYASDGSHVTSIMKGEAMDTADKSTNKAMSTAYKYALMQLLMIPTEDDKDPDAKTHEPAAKAQTNPQNNNRAPASNSKPQAATKTTTPTKASTPPVRLIAEDQKLEIARQAAMTHIFSPEESKKMIEWVAKNPTEEQAQKAIDRHNNLIQEREAILLKEQEESQQD